MRILILGAAIALCACDRSVDQGQAVPPNAYDQQLQSLSAPARNLGFRNAIKDSRAKCARVDRSFRQQAYKGSAMWVARCTDTGDFAIFVSAGGFAQIVACDNLGEGAPACQPLKDGG